MPERSRPRHPALAAGLSFVFPGLGQAYAGRFRTAVLLGGPVIAIVGAGTLVVLSRWSELRNELLSSTFLWTLIAVDLAVLAWRVTAIGHAWLTTDAAAGREATTHYPLARARLITERWRRSPLTLAAVAMLVAATIGMHGYIAILAGTLNATLSDVFAEDQSAAPVQAPAAGGQPPVPAEVTQPLNIPDYHWDGTDPINFLLLGVDSGPGRSHALDDTILVVSVDPVEQEAVLISVPRDTGYVPLPDESIYAGGIYPWRINELSSEARLSPEIWCPDLPASVDCGLRTLERTVGLYLGITIHYYAQVDLEGFSRLIDELGGVELCLPGRLVDPEYSGPTWYSRAVGVVLEAGCHQLAGPEALAYARVRKGYLELPNGEIVYQNDFERVARQQQLLLQLRRELASIPVLELPGVLNAIGGTITTDFPRSLAGDLASLLPTITRSDVEQVVLGYPDYVDPPIDEANNYVLIPKRDVIRQRMQQLLRHDRPLEGWYLGTFAASPSEAAALPTPPEQPVPQPSADPLSSPTSSRAFWPT